MTKLRSCDYTQEQRDFLITGYKNMPATELVVAFNSKFGTSKSASAIKTRLTSWGAKSGRTGCFERGQPAWNKGKKGVNGKSDTAFKPGNFPHNTKPDLYERVGKDGEIQIKVGVRGKTFISKARYLWEKKNGPVPKGYIVRFKNGDNRDFRDSNLACVSRAEHARLNRMRANDYPEQVLDSVYLVSNVRDKMRERQA